MAGKLGVAKRKGEVVPEASRPKQKKELKEIRRMREPAPVARYLGEEKNKKASANSKKIGKREKNEDLTPQEKDLRKEKKMGKLAFEAIFLSS